MEEDEAANVNGNGIRLHHTTQTWAGQVYGVPLTGMANHRLCVMGMRGRGVSASSAFHDTAHHVAWGVALEALILSQAFAWGVALEALILSQALGNQATSTPRFFSFGYTIKCFKQGWIESLIGGLDGWNLRKQMYLGCSSFAKSRKPNRKEKSAKG
ncbi:hypothetical protein L1987_39430 [Smallanthus sonchifolius]|uniref:Uncharacterized protein n=1 Tax=Smallanthus sonchifolius TaxID=185202 RepID=A0ACB9HLT0_9ASTR|nr:hypothetical protein L1987_39430 [Smallanthus sonchifolius]